MVEIRGTIAEQIRFGSGLEEARRLSAAPQQFVTTPQTTPQVLEQPDTEKQKRFFTSEIARVRNALAEEARLGRSGERKARLEAELGGLIRASGKVGQASLEELRGFATQVGEAKLSRDVQVRTARGEAQERQITEFRGQGLTPIFVGGELRGFESKVAQQSFRLQDLPSIQPSAIAPLERIGLIRVTRTEAPTQAPALEQLGVTQSFPIQQPTRLQSFVGGISKAQTPSLIGVGPFGVRRSRSQIDFLTSIDVGIAKTGIETVAFGRQFLTSPILTTRGVITGFGELIREPRQAIQRGLTFVRERPGEAIGRGIGEVLLFKGTGKVTSIAGRGLEIGTTRISPKFRAIETRTIPGLKAEEQFIGGIPTIGDIGLIPPGLERRAGTIRPTVRGGFGFTRVEQAAFIGERGPVVTAQVGFTGFGVPLERELFATPPLKGIGFVRVSRLALAEPKAPTITQVLKGEFTFRRTKPQIIAFPGEVIGRPGGFEPFGLPSTELEVILPPGRIPKRIGEPALTLIEGRRVPIITAEIVEATPKVSTLFRRGISGERLTAKEVRRLTKETGFDISRPIVSRPIISLPRTGISGGVSFLTRLRSGLGFTPTTISRRATSLGLPRSGGISGITTGFPSGLSGISPTVSGLGLPGVGTTRGFFPLSISEGFDIVRPRVDIDRRRKKKKKVSKRRRFDFPISVSFTAVAADLFGPFPKIRFQQLGLTPEQIRFQPISKAPRRPSLAGVRARRRKKR